VIAAVEEKRNPLWLFRQCSSTNKTDLCTFSAKAQ